MNKAKATEYTRTDLACESGVTLDHSVAGAQYREYDCHGISAAELVVTDDEGVAATGRDKGRYVTLSFGRLTLMSHEEKDMLEAAIAEELTSFIEAAAGRITPSTKVLVAGLGNRYITADSLGPAAADGVYVTRHVMGKVKALDSLGCSVISAVAPGVLGQTGIEAAELIRGAAALVKPDVIIAVDALAARSVSRLCTTVQLSDSGISPGSGIGNRRLAIDSRSMGAPVVALGVPTVVDSSSMVYDALDEAGIEEIDGALDDVLKNGRSFFVSLKESDTVIRSLSELICGAINSIFSTDIF